MTDLWLGNSKDVTRAAQAAGIAAPNVIQTLDDLDGHAPPFRIHECGRAYQLAFYWELHAVLKRPGNDWVRHASH